MEHLTAANTQFCLDLFKKIRKENASGNVFFSPVSISSALAMVSLGARGNTADQMNKVLGFNKEPPMMQQTQSPPTPAELKKCPQEKPEDQIHSSFNKFMSELNKPGVPYALSLANRLYGEQSYQFVEEFLNDAKSYYEAGLEKVDFISQSEAARVNINKWVEKKTQEKIKDLLPQGSIDEMTKLVLVNAIYFKGNWENKFPKEDTRDGQFKLNKLEKALTYEKLMEWTKPEVMPQQEVQISLPRFKMEEKYDMKSLLISMGMKDVFDLQKVNLSGMSSNNDLVLSKVIHKAFVEVNEEGTEAAAATGAIVMVDCCRFPQVFNADHPFLFFIRHNPSKSILFYGRFCSP
ncbi:serpin B6-like isoform X3 [Pimephales promelas]|uniref:serpin B6-like isoform X3 n=1 Tax=Pimephales promelas TaxID=90988 RepID=UPI0019556ED1|nr:serpin B6-like isoform X3 [Pimephales promelas]